MALTAYLCENCGFWRRLPERPAADCPVCLDHRHAPPPDAWSFLSEDEVATRARTTVTEVEDGIWRLGSSERFHIGPSGYFVTHPEGNVVFEAPNWVDDDALGFLSDHGGVAWSTASARASRSPSPTCRRTPRTRSTRRSRQRTWPTPNGSSTTCGP